MGVDLDKLESVLDCCVTIITVDHHLVVEADGAVLARGGEGVEILGEDAELLGMNGGEEC